MKYKLPIILVILLFSVQLKAQYSEIYQQQSPVFPYETIEINTADCFDGAPFKRINGSSIAKSSGTQVLNKYYNDNGDISWDWSWDIIQIDSFYYLSGRTKSYYGNELPFAMKININGDLVWKRKDSLADADHWDSYSGQSLCQLSNGNLLQAFHIKLNDTVVKKTIHYPAFVSYDKNSNTKFSDIWPDTTDFSLRGTVADDNGGFTFTGQLGSRTMSWVYYETLGYGNWIPDSFYVGIVNMDSNLNIVNQNKLYINAFDDYFIVEEIVKGNNGGYIVGGQQADGTGINGYVAATYFLLKFDSLLNLEWSKTMKDSVVSYENPIKIVPSKFGGYLYSREHLTKGIIYGKFNENGDILWEHSYKNTMDSLRPEFAIEDRPWGIIEKDNGDIIFGTRINYYEAAGLVRTDSMGNVKWARAIGTLKKEGYITPFWLFNVRNPQGEGALLVGGSHTLCAALNRTDSMGCTLPNCIDTVMWVGIEEIGELQSKLLIVYPNPAHDKLQIAVNKQGSKLTQISIYNIQGKEIFSEELGVFLFTHDVSNLANGVYIVKVVDNNDNVFTEKFIKE